jgi:hypothetical protein
VRFVAEEEVGNFFAAADVALLTYSAKFRSASGVLNTAVHFQKPCLASSGQGNLQGVVRDYGLGMWVEPDSEEAITQGLRDLLQRPPTPDWDRYGKENSWSRNAQLVIERMFGT